MKLIWKVLLVLIVVAILAILTQPLWRYRVWMASGTTRRYDRLTGEVQEWNTEHGGQWEKYQTKPIFIE